MNHNYTWSHLLILAKICERRDSEDTVTASWVEIVENHHKNTFPFTLWPLSYRTSDITTSPAISSPIFLSGEELGCNFSVKMYRCNEVIIVCVQRDDGVDDDELTCTKNCSVENDFSEFDGNSKFHSLQHSNILSKPLVTCHLAHNYFRIKEKSMSCIYELQNYNSNDNLESIIFTGFGISAHMASCLAVDISRGYEIERDFLGMEKKRVSVDFIGFSSNMLASPVYWSSPGGHIDIYTTIKLYSKKTDVTTDLSEYPKNSILILTSDIDKPPISRKFLKFKKKTTVSKKEETIENYIKLIQDKITIS
jgi:hypothetical protein